MYLLRFLGLRGTPIRVLPSKIGDLDCLDSLDVEGTEINPHKVPLAVTKLSKLERILPRGLRNMKALREVAFAHLDAGDGDVEVAPDIGELQQLQVLFLQILVKVDDQDPKEEDFLRALGSSLSKTYALPTLLFKSVCQSGYGSLDFLLHVSSLPPLLRRLHMQGRISRFPDFISSLQHLAELSVEEAQLAADQLLDPLSELPSLQSLQLGFRSCRDPELVVAARTKHRLPVLSILDLSVADPLQVIKFDQGSMTKLQTLRLSFSSFSGESSIIAGIDTLKNLKEVKLCGREHHRSLLCALQQLKEENKNRLDSNQIKVVMEDW